MLKGHVFKEQVFGNQIFALFADTFLDKKCGIFNYKNNMKLTVTGNKIVVNSGCICIRGRLLEEDTYTEIATDTDTVFCRLVIEINLNKENTDVSFNQATYRIVKGITGYPNLTQNNIVANNSGVYQYELARFKTSNNGIESFKDMRTFIDFDSIYAEIRQKIKNIEMGELDLLNKIYPVGSVYISVNSTSPAKLFGGTWTLIKDRFLLATGDTYTAGKTGGEAMHTLIEREIPSHGHKIHDYLVSAQGGGSFTVPSVSKATSAVSYASRTGGGVAHNNMPPYLAVYIWKRTA